MSHVGLMSPDSAQPPAGLSQPPLSPHSADSRKENAGVRAPNHSSNIVTKWEPRSKSKISGGMSKRTGDAVKCANTSRPNRVSTLSGGTSAAAVVSKPLDGCVHSHSDVGTVQDNRLTHTLCNVEPHDVPPLHKPCGNQAGDLSKGNRLC